jgi:glycosyltransferase involved in cell wall biosynthesis
MKIAMVSEHASPLAVPGCAGVGGQHVHVAELSAALTRRGHAVTVYTRREDPALPDRVETPEGYAVVHVPAGPAEPLPTDEVLSFLGPFAQFLDAQWSADRPDVTHAHFWTSGIATQLAARHLGLPAIQTFHDLGVLERRHSSGNATGPRERVRLEAAVARGASWVVAACAEEVLEVVGMGRPRARISVVPGGVDVEIFTPDGPAAPHGDQHRIVSVGSLVSRNGFDVVVRALPAIPDTEFVLVGGPATAEHSDPEARRLSKLAEDVGVADRVQFHGSVAREDMPAVLRSADIVACTPYYELFGIVPLEAMACGAPVVAAAVGGMLDTVVHDVTGKLVKPNSPGDVAAAVKQLVRDDFLRQSLGAAGRDRAKARYSWDRIAADTLRIYDQMLPAAQPVSAAPASKLSSV